MLIFLILAVQNIHLDDKYFADFSARNDQSSRFGKDNRSAMFYSGGLMWNAKKASFLQDNNIISGLNLKASLGTSGNSEIGNYANLATVNTIQNTINTNAAGYNMYKRYRLVNIHLRKS